MTSEVTPGKTRLSTKHDWSPSEIALVHRVHRPVAEVDQSLRLRFLAVLEVVQVLLFPVQNKKQRLPLLAFVAFFAHACKDATCRHMRTICYPHLAEVVKTTFNISKRIRLFLNIK